MANQKLTERGYSSVSSPNDVLHIVKNNKSYKQKVEILVDDKIEAVQDQLTGIASGYKGFLAISDTPTEDGYYYASESGTYTNAGGLVVSLDSKLTIITVSGSQTIFSKTEIPVGDLGYDIVPNIATFNSLVSSNKAGTWLILEDITLTANTTIPEDVTLYFNGGVISLGGFNLTGTGTRIDSDLKQIFDTNGDIDGDWIVGAYYPEWFGAVGDGVVDDFSALSKVLAIPYANVVFSKIYHTTTTLEVATNVRMTGVGGRANSQRGKITGDIGIVLIDFSSSNTETIVGDKSGLVIENMVLGGKDGAGNYVDIVLKMQTVSKASITNCYITKARTGVYLRQVYDSQFYSTYFINILAETGVEAHGVLMETSTVGNTNQIDFYSCVWETIQCSYNAGTIDGQAYALKAIGQASGGSLRNNKIKIQGSHFEPSDKNTYMLHTYYSYNFFIGGGTNFSIENTAETEQNPPFYIENPYTIVFDSIVLEYGIIPTLSPFYFTASSNANVLITNLHWLVNGQPTVYLISQNGIFSDDSLRASITLNNISLNGNRAPEVYKQFGTTHLGNTKSVDKNINIFELTNIDAGSEILRKILLRKETGSFKLQSFEDTGGYGGDLVAWDLSGTVPIALIKSDVRMTALQTHIDEAAATTAGVSVGTLYSTPTGELRIKL